MIRDIERSFQNREIDLIDRRNSYGIIVPIVKIDGSYDLIYQVRSRKLRRQPGEISFPGGRVERGETFLEGAVRECMEELCMARDKIKILGELDLLVTDYKALIRTYLAYIDGMEYGDIEANKEEVESLFTVPIDYLMEVEPEVYRVEFDFSGDSNLPYDLIPNGRDYEWDKRYEDVYFYRYKDKVIWGLTARLTKNFIDICKEDKK